MTKETIQKEHRILQLKYAVLAVVVGICVGIVDTIFGRGLLAISDLRTAHWRYLLPFLPLAGLLIVWMYHHFSTLSLKGMSLIFETGQEKKRPDSSGPCPSGNDRHLDHSSLRRKCRS